MSSERASVTLLVAAALGLAAILSAVTADLGRVAQGRVRVQAAADAAALAAAQELVVPTSASPAQVAEDYASRFRAEVVDCRCDPGSDEVTVAVELTVTTPFTGGTRTLVARARAVVEPVAMAGLTPAFASMLACLFARVPGLRIISGFRTTEEQAQLHREKPHLAAPPGHSMHELGLAADLGFPSDDARADAHRLAPACGLEFPVPHEPWHVEPAAA